MPRTCDAPIRHEAVVQRIANVQALVLDGSDLPCYREDGNESVAYLHGPAPIRRKVLASADRTPGHSKKV